MGLRKYEDVNKRIWFFEIGSIDFIVEIKKRKFINLFKIRRTLHLKI